MASVHAQGASHIAFRGTPLDRTVGEYATALSQQGYTMQRQQGNLAVMTGDFAGQKATLYVAGSKRSHKVWKVRVALQPTPSWSELKSRYEEMKEAFTEKYGVPDLAYEFFSRPYRDGDGQEMAALRNGKCTYLCTFSVPGGTVWMKMERQGTLSINYEDAAHTALNKEESKTTLIDDL